MPRELAFTSPPALAVAAGATTPVGQLGAEIWSTTALRRLVWTGTQWVDAVGGGNAATATALQTARTINGVSFNGTANITLPTVNTTGDQTINGIKTFNGHIVTGAGRYTMSNTSVAMYEMHLVGRAASAWRLQSNGTVDLVTTNGGGVANSTLLSVTTAGHLTATGNITAGGNVLVTGASGGLGYGTGTGGAVTQATSKSTAVTLNRPTGRITMNNAELPAGATVGFNLSNSTCGPDDVLLVNIINANGVNVLNYRAEANILAAGVGYIQVTNISGGSLSEAVTINYAIIKGATS